ncbi:MAG TPA: glycosyltransferase family 39 protein [Thermoanaerobaculaceae bacterium]|nr:glycosyltransferase family 39 protein [Thermoanaerobaculaceae bacterium]HRS14975.1 glycosyltransferase family 39 protein [Thermoanaerobaculaceae bacterium]
MLALVLVVAAAVRVVGIGELPAGLFCDEAALGYNAWAILHTGQDENGVRFPLFVWSFGGFKNPVFIYTAMLPVGLLGLSETSVRLTSALFGVLTVLALYLLGKELGGARLGLIAAGLLAVTPWHVHFSRIAFELISFPFLFVLGLWQLVRFVHGRRSLPLAMLLLALTPYAYAIAKLFVPLFLVAFVALFPETVWRRWREWLAGGLVFAAVCAPLVVFEVKNRDRGSRYFALNSIFRDGGSQAAVARRFTRNYQAFFSPSFLFEEGDPNARHAVRQHGELYPFFAPLLVAGAGSLLARRRRVFWLLPAWLAAYPVGASLMTEIPSASRGFIGVAAFVLLAAEGVDGLFRLAGRLARRPLTRRAATTTVAAGLGAALLPAAVDYATSYVFVYPRYSAPSLYGFEYGLRDAIQSMERLRGEYEQLALTATGTLEPYIFALFYTRRDPREFAATRNSGYLEVDPMDFDRLDLRRRTLIALRPEDLVLFSDFTVRDRVLGPGARLEYLITEVRRHTAFVRDWSILGPLANPDGLGIDQDPGPLDPPERVVRPDPLGDAYWAPVRTRSCYLDLADLFAEANPGFDAGVKRACAEVFTSATTSEGGVAWLELRAGAAEALVWVNAARVTPWVVRSGDAPVRFPVRLRAGANSIVVRTCHSQGEWRLRLRLVDAEGRDLPGVTYAGTLEEARGEPARPLAAPQHLQVVEGFAQSVSAPNSADMYGDYRGGCPSRWIYARDAGAGLVWKTAAPSESLPAALVFTASMGEAPGTAELWVDRRYALTFDLGDDFAARAWSRGRYGLIFVRRGMFAGSSGFCVVLLPEEAVQVGQPIELAVRGLRARGDGDPWFMVKERTDTARHEHVDAAAVRAWLDLQASSLSHAEAAAQEQTEGGGGGA